MNVAHRFNPRDKHVAKTPPAQRIDLQGGATPDRMVCCSVGNTTVFSGTNVVPPSERASYIATLDAAVNCMNVQFGNVRFVAEVLTD